MARPDTESRMRLNRHNNAVCKGCGQRIRKSMDFFDRKVPPEKEGGEVKRERYHPLCAVKALGGAAGINNTIEDPKTRQALMSYAKGSF